MSDLSDPDLSVIVRLWTTPKPDAESGRENEDRFWIAGYRVGERFARPVGIALSDGASEGLFTREWARELARVTSQSQPRSVEALDEAAAAAVAVWRERTGNRQLPWFLEARRAHPVGASLLCLSVQPLGVWSALAVGDTCVFQVSAARGLICSFPALRGDEFGVIPDLVRTERGGEIVPSFALHRVEQDWEAGDRLYMMTDALAAWFVREAEAGHAPWRWLDDIRDDADFRQRIRTLRTDGRLKGDDTTLIQVRFEPIG